ncbi:MAG: hypothetical protein L3J39_06070 [Verrucomicrobiales bacterium]|nr:hypothetical protein [Verrucomicrobiales bacterium]
MRRRSFATWVILLLLLVGLVTAFAMIMELRFSPGDIYPHYSTKRSDPLGSRALYEALEKLPQMEVSRNLLPLHRISGLDGDTALVLLGLSRNSLNKIRVKSESRVLKAVHEGTTMVVMMNPGFVPMEHESKDGEEDWFERREDAKRKYRKGVKDEEEKSEEEEEDRWGQHLLRFLDIKLVALADFKRPEEGWTLLAPTKKDAAEVKDGAELPKSFPQWYSQFRFADLGEAWRVVAEVDGQAVVVERAYGKGRVVLASDVYFASNEALWKDGDTSFLWWLIGGKSKVVFDETIHGSKETGGIMKLIRRYRLHGFFIGLFVFLALLAWRSGSSLVPGSDEADRGMREIGGRVTGEDAASGLVRLLRRNVRANELLDKCMEVWRQSSSQRGGLSSTLTAEQEREVEQILNERRTKPKDLPLNVAYERLVKVLRKKTL